jgi:hypothetical protein
VLNPEKKPIFNPKEKSLFLQMTPLRPRRTLKDSQGLDKEKMERDEQGRTQIKPNRN